MEQIDMHLAQSSTLKMPEKEIRIRKHKKEKANYSKRLKKELKLSKNVIYQRALKFYLTPPMIFTMLQYREILKNKVGHRFTNDEKLMALALYRQGPKAYRWLKKKFVLPSPVILSRISSSDALKLEINDILFKQLEQKVKKMERNNKLCILMFDEMAILPYFKYHRTDEKIADHTMVFMIRGVCKNYLHPIQYIFSVGPTKVTDLKLLITDVIKNLKSIGLEVIATVCDQSTTNVTTINDFIADTRAVHLKSNKDLKVNIFKIDDQEVIPLYDPLHLIKAVRNNLLTKTLKCVIDGQELRAKWEHVQELYQRNPAYRGLSLISKLTENHVYPKKMQKMKVKYAIQVFSQTVASYMGYLANRKILTEECKQTAEVILFFDKLFDSVNGSYENFKNGPDKKLLGPVTPKSNHRVVWNNAKNVLKSMKFVTEQGKSGVVPSLRHWLHTIENLEYLQQKLYQQHNLKSIWMSRFNQDPLEEFFGCVRGHGCRYINPDRALKLLLYH